MNPSQKPPIIETATDKYLQFSNKARLTCHQCVSPSEGVLHRPSSGGTFLTRRL